MRNPSGNNGVAPMAFLAETIVVTAIIQCIAAEAGRLVITLLRALGAWTA